QRRLLGSRLIMASNPLVIPAADGALSYSFPVRPALQPWSRASIPRCQQPVDNFGSPGSAFDDRNPAVTAGYQLGEIEKRPSTCGFIARHADGPLPDRNGTACCTGRVEPWGQLAIAGDNSTNRMERR
ncbi:hypothetical protein, partial [Nocardia farcinica]|uniref:hypothetical protein n=1 Tax=Nocardia farcinica TaxID=37329 RepID=UPI0034DB7382